MSSYILLYGIEVCPVSKSDNSFDFAINRFLMKLFKTNINIGLIEECRVNFGMMLPSSLALGLITSITVKFMFKLQFLENSFCNIFNKPVYLAHRTIVLHLLIARYLRYYYQ